ncbi:tryptophan synthase subunit alpha [Pyrococcus abyssi]|uniref:Tryptophan synthase alpha chain n=1 Tax=Pyrococcus abyssi (strain GE5 / Orsay) TaxID=272844 RepID=TRPA_PYRAB|nr:tryptophan synthase subunit alpha [Pyrococcus abyssi]Q9V1G9.1 RecName: Full=Tryptophan synthase alpha chain [Pyrococcus abyssi GE5]CAB49380.1 trpA tryptophan synthase, subunit alpha (EC 4.2.1.20) [Pyrococcus abyssi GE5]CCE69841.1 TPA: tryptophan synthase subunit alpha [Pyrococcus abyssi GE5]
MFRDGSLIPYLTAGDPSAKATLRFLLAIEEYSGAIELGIPFSDPIADGKTIQQSHFRALKGGFKLEHAFNIVREFRKHSDVPIVLMTYYNPVFRVGLREFIGKAKDSGVDGMLIVDLPVMHASEFLEVAREEGIKTVFLAAPNTPDERLKEIDKASTGFVYLISLYGTTGARDKIPETAFNLLKRAKRICKNKVAVGFGVSKREHVEMLLNAGANGVVVGSALINIIAEHGENAEEKLREKVRELAGL